MRSRRKTTSGTRVRIRPDGMTLVELMVVLIIMLLVTGAISRLLARAGESQDTIMGQNLMQKYAQQAADAVADRLRGASEITTGSDTDVTAAFGSGDTVRYYLQDARLKRDVYSHASGQTASGEVVCRDVLALDFDYFVRSGSSWAPAATAAVADSLKLSVTVRSDKYSATETSAVRLRNKR